MPDDLTAYFGFASWVFSLGTRDLHLANAKASKYAVDHGNLIEIARQKLTADPAARFGAEPIAIREMAPVVPSSAPTLVQPVDEIDWDDPAEAIKLLNAAISREREPQPLPNEPTVPDDVSEATFRSTVLQWADEVLTMMERDRLEHIPSDANEALARRSNVERQIRGLQEDASTYRAEFSAVPAHASRAMVLAFRQHGLTLDPNASVAKAYWRAFTRLALAILNEKDLTLAYEDHRPKKTKVLKLARKLFGVPQDGAQKANPSSDKAPITIAELFEHWRKTKAAEGGAPSSAKRWRKPVATLATYMGTDDAHAVTPDHIISWRDHLFETGVTRGTFARTHLPAVRAIYGLGKSDRLVALNPAKETRAIAPDIIRTRPKGFTDDEAAMILKSANAAMEAPGGTKPLLRRALRWVPWLCAYTGARVGEMAQLRKQDVFRVRGIWCIRITPEAGTVKTKTFRDIPIHSHLIEMGFVDFVAGMPDGPLFYFAGSKSATPWATTTGRISGWVRATAGVTDPRVKPSHAWRHSFKTQARLVGMEAFYSDLICGHVPANVGADYGDAPVEALVREIERLPRWSTTVHLSSATVP